MAFLAISLCVLGGFARNVLNAGPSTGREREKVKTERDAPATHLSLTAWPARRIARAIMNTKIGLLACVLAVAPAWTSICVAEPSLPPTTGHILILENERTLEGDIERVGDQYRIKRTLGETWVPADKVLWLSADLPEAFAFLRRRANLDDADERLRLAKWCHAHDLKEQALAEVTAAVALQPRQQEAQRLLRRLQQPGPAAPSTATSPSEPEPVALPPVNVSAEVMNQFITRVQPILMNACVNCHGADQAGTFKLVKIHEHGSLAPKTTQQNLASVLAQMNLEQPGASPFLTKAASLHGSMREAPLAGKRMPAFHTLEEWVKLTLPRQPISPDQSLAAAVDGSAKPNKTAAPKAVLPAVEKSTAAVKIEEGKTPATGKSATEEPADPFDPVIFNRETHPDR
jgi:hypothetical protein